MAYSLFDFEHGTPKPKVAPKKKPIKASVPVVYVAEVPKPDPVYDANYYLAGVAGDNQFFRLDCVWQDGMSEAEVRAVWDNPENFGGFVCYQAVNCLVRYKLLGGSFEELWQAVLRERVKHWLYWFATFVRDYQRDHFELTALLNFRDCQTQCKECSRPCVVKPEKHSSIDGFPEENAYFFDCINRVAVSLGRYLSEFEVYAVALGKAGVDLNLVDLDEVLTGKRRVAKKAKSKKKEAS